MFFCFAAELESLKWLPVPSSEEEDPDEVSFGSMKDLQGSRDGFPALWLPGFLLRICQGTCPWETGKSWKLQVAAAMEVMVTQEAPELTRLDQRLTIALAIHLADYIDN